MARTEPMQPCEAAEMLLGLSDGLFLLAAAAGDGDYLQPHKRRSEVQAQEFVDFECSALASLPDGNARPSLGKRRRLIGGTQCTTPEVQLQHSRRRSKQQGWDTLIQEHEVQATEDPSQEASTHMSEISLGIWQADVDEDEVDSGSSSWDATAVDLFVGDEDEDTSSSMPSHERHDKGFEFPCLAAECFPVWPWAR